MQTITPSFDPTTKERIDELLAQLANESETFNAFEYLVFALQEKHGDELCIELKRALGEWELFEAQMAEHKDELEIIRMEDISNHARRMGIAA